MEDADHDFKALMTLHLLLVEDDTDSGEAMTELLRAQGVAVDWVSSGAEALQLFRDDPTHAVDVMMLDLTLPDMSGLTLLERLSEFIKLPPVVIHSAASRSRALEVGRQVGAAAVLQKPTVWREMKDLLERCRLAAGARASGNGA